MCRMGEIGQLTGAKDRHGVEIKIGDTLRFDFNEWNRTVFPPEEREDCVFVMEYKDGELSHPGTYGDLSEWCEIIPARSVREAAEDGSIL